MDKDLISRKAVQDMIDRIAEMHPYRQIGKPETYSEYNEAWEDAVNRIGAELNDLPSAQPEHLVKGCGNLVKGLVNDCISRQAAIDALGDKPLAWTEGEYELGLQTQWQSDVDALKDLPPVQPESKREWYMHGYRDAQPRWIPIKWHDCTAEEREEYRFGEEIVRVFDCDMPSDNQEILVTTSHGYVEKDVCYIDDGFSLDSGYDWIEDITAWMPLPEPYKEGQDD